MEDINPKNVLEVSNLNTWYGNKKILSDINLSVSHKEIMVIMGHSGSGKSTLLRYILGLEKTKTGLIKLLDKEVSKLNKKDLYKLRKRIGVAFQNGALFSSMTVRENIELPLHETALEHLFQGYSFSPQSILKCVFKLPSREKVFLH